MGGEEYPFVEYFIHPCFEVLTTFGELTPEVSHHKKYAKWKAAYIHNCLKNGETPIAGPMATGEDDDLQLPGVPGRFLGAVGYFALTSDTNPAPNFVILGLRSLWMNRHAKKIINCLSKAKTI